MLFPMLRQVREAVFSHGTLFRNEVVSSVIEQIMYDIAKTLCRSPAGKIIVSSIQQIHQMLVVAIDHFMFD